MTSVLLLSGGAVAGAASPAPPAPPSGPGHDPGGGLGSGGTGASICSPFANPSHFGFDCSGVPPETVDQMLHGDPIPTCWDEVITVPAKYGYKVVAGDPPYYIHTCLTGVDGGHSPHNQQTMQIDQTIITIPITGGYCPPPPPPATSFNELETGHCIMWLKEPNQAAVAAAILQGAIPDALISPHPSSTLRTNVLTWFGNYSFGEDGQLVTIKTNTVARGPVSIFAHRDHFRIFPYGLANGSNPSCANWSYWSTRTKPVSPGTCEECDGTTLLQDSSTAPDDPLACWWSYPSSSKGWGTAPDLDTYPFATEADWTVLFTDDHGHDNFPEQTFQKFTTLHLAVNDVQDLNLG